MLLLAADLAGWPMVAVIAPGLFLSFWIACIVVWAHALQRRWQLIASAVITAYAVGGIFVWYAGIDLGRGLKNGGADDFFGPLIVLLTSPTHPAAGGWALLFALLASGLAVIAISKIVRVFW